MRKKIQPSMPDGVKTNTCLVTVANSKKSIIYKIQSKIDYFQLRKKEFKQIPNMFKTGKISTPQLAYKGCHKAYVLRIS